MSENLPVYVLDSHALLAYLEGETGQDQIISLLDDARLGRAHLAICLINWGEVLYITERERGLMATQRVIAAVDQLPLTLVPVDRNLTLAAAHVKARYSLAYADAFVVALARMQHATIVTGDPEFHLVEGLVRVRWLSSATLPK